MPSRVPHRIAWAVDQLALEPHERVLEIGCGRGVAIELVADRLRTGRVTGIDRSAGAIAAASSRNRASVSAGRARLLVVPLADLDLGESFDKIFAINVNVFWMNLARELRVIAGLLAPAGRLCLFYEPPSAGLIRGITRKCTANLQDAGFAVVDVRRADLTSTVCLIASPPRD